MGTHPVALTIAGSDSGGGAGIQADLKTFQAFGVFGTSAVTAVTAQNTTGVSAIQKIDPKVVAEQIDAVAEDLKPEAVKSGMLVDSATIEVVADSLKKLNCDHYVLDPVMVAKSGARLLEQDSIGALIAFLLPIAELVTPNLPEAAILAEMPVNTIGDMKAAAKAIIARGPRSVLIKGGHLDDRSVVDIYYDGRNWKEWSNPRLQTRHTHGTGCTLSAAICAGLALGQPRESAIERARSFTRRAIDSAPGIGRGYGPLNHWVDAVDSA